MADGILVGSGGVNVNPSGLIVDASGTPCCCGETLYRRARYCFQGALAWFVMTTGDASTFSEAFYLNSEPEGTCFYFDFDDDPITATDVSDLNLTIIAADDATDAGACEDCPCVDPDACSDGTTPTSVTLGISAGGSLDFGTTNPTNAHSPDSTSVTMNRIVNCSGSGGLKYEAVTQITISGFTTVNPKPNITAISDGFGNPMWLLLFSFQSTSNPNGTVQFTYVKPRCAENVDGTYVAGPPFGVDNNVPELGTDSTKIFVVG